MKQDNEDLKDYLDNKDPAEQTATPAEKSTALKKLHFWSDWSKNKKIALLVSVLTTPILIALLMIIFIRPSKTSSYITNSWHDLVASSASIDRAVKSEVNLEGTRDLTKELYNYNEKLNSVSFDAKSKSSLTYKTSVTKGYASLTSDMGSYFSDSATILAKTDTDITSISDQDLSSLKTKGEDIKTKVDSFRTQNKLEEEINPNLFSLDVYISDVKSKKEDIDKEKKAEAAAIAAKESSDKANVEAVGDSYFKAFINGSETGVRATLTKGYQGEYDFGSLTPARRTSFYPKSHRIVTVVKDGENYKLTGSVTYISVYQDSGGNNVESKQPVTEIYRVVYVSETGSWKIDGRIES